MKTPIGKRASENISQDILGNFRKQWETLFLVLLNQVIFGSYPNNESIEGSNMSLQLMQNIEKIGGCTV